MKILLDVNMPSDLAVALQQRGHIARHAAKAGFPKATDIELIEIARLQDETIITHDLDFGQLLAFTGYSQPSVIIFRIHHINARLFENLLVLNWDLIEEPLRNGALIIIEEEKIRIRKLPL
ncbi:hypothetical protein BH09BAC1_BH09BAC1_26240 [soil metagenome]